jgi:ketosteroid isomerase-like protein
MTTDHGRSEDEAAIRGVIESWTSAVRRGDVEEILKNHSPDIVMFDVSPPFQSRGIEAYRKTWNTFFSWSNDPIHFDVTDMDITAGNDVAFVVATMRCAGPGTDGKPEALDVRLTVGLPLSALTGIKADYFGFVIGACWMAAFVVTGWRAALFPCPRCHKWFFATWWYRNPFARKCVHCGLPKWANSEPSISN